jgi:hypothetical protein
MDNNTILVFPNCKWGIQLRDRENIIYTYILLLNSTLFLDRNALSQRKMISPLSQRNVDAGDDTQGGHI